MNLYKQLAWPLLRGPDPESVHGWTLRALATAQRFVFGRALLRAIAGDIPRRPVTVFGLTFPNVLGLAAGFDKDVHVAQGLGLLGFGHVEVGTLTPRPQPGNPRPRIFRLPADEGLINWMGFPNGGIEAALPRLKAVAEGRRSFILGVSPGKQKETPLAEAAQDYAAVMAAAYPYADYLAMNISSPNTPGLRELQGGDFLSRFMGDLQAENRRLATAHNRPRRPMLVKIDPDLSWTELDEILQAVADNDIDGIIATNTTLNREGLVDPNKDEPGGVSGRPLCARNTEVIAHIARETNGRLPIVAVGGVHGPDDARAKLDAGASLVQVYTGLVYEGPGLPGRILRSLG